MQLLPMEHIRLLLLHCSINAHLHRCQFFLIYGTRDRFVEKGSVINTDAVERILQRVWAFIAAEEWSKAEDLLDKLISAKPWDRKLLLNKAHLRKKMWLSSSCEDYELLKDATHLFSRCHLLTGSPEAGINTATLLLIAGNEDEAYQKAAETAAHCRAVMMDSESEPDGYLLAVMGEANLIRGRLEAAEAWYDAACAQDDSIAEIFKENMNLLIDHIVPETRSILKIRKSLRA